jgi:hypothetical protein
MLGDLVNDFYFVITQAGEVVPLDVAIPDETSKDDGQDEVAVVVYFVDIVAALCGAEFRGSHVVDVFDAR